MKLLLKSLWTNKSLAVAVAVLVVCLVFPGTALAVEDIGEGGGLPYEDGLKSLAASITGPVPFVISLAGIVGCGAMLIFGGEISGFMRTMVFIVLVVAVIVQAGSIVTMMKGSPTSGGGKPGMMIHAAQPRTV